MRKINIQTSFQPDLEFLCLFLKSVIMSSSEVLDLLHYYFLFLCCLQLGLVTQRTGLELKMNPINLDRTLCIVLEQAPALTFRKVLTLEEEKVTGKNMTPFSILSLDPSSCSVYLYETLLLTSKAASID